MARTGAAEGTVVWARMQTAGRGRQGNVWISGSGNLFMSVILRPKASLRDIGQLSFLAAVALARVLRPLLSREQSGALSLKWPNDVLVDGKKVAGILLETESSGNGLADWVVIGIGVNITSAPEEATDLRKYTQGDDVDSASVFEKLVFEIFSLYDVWQESGFAPIRQEWLDLAGGLGQEIRIRLPQETFTARFLEIDSTGALCVEMRDGTRRMVSSGEVYTGRE